MRAAIDIGTNTVLLLVADIENGRLKVIDERQRVPRLGKGVDQAKNVSVEAMNRVIDALTEYQEILESRYPSVSAIEVTATSAVRDAANRDEFLGTVKESTGFDVKVLSGSEEARYTFAGALSVLRRELIGEQNVVIDIGGGSTEIASGDATLVGDRYSFDMGCVRFTERFLHEDPPTEQQVGRCREGIQQMLGEYKFNFNNGASLIGVAGTVTSLAYIDAGLKKYDNRPLNGYKLSLDTIESYITTFRTLTADQLRERYPEVMAGRADIFLAGLFILEGFMNKYGFKKLLTSTGGIRHGAILGMTD